MSELQNIIAQAQKEGPLEQPYKCKWCDKKFSKESTLISHLCEPKRRYQQRNEVGPRIGMMAYQRFYQKIRGRDTVKTAEDFEKSSYYGAFVKFGWYVHSIRAIAVERFVDWLLDNNKKLDRWATDANYQEFLITYILHENPQDAVERTVLTADEWSQETGSPVNHYFRYATTNRICHDITNGRVSPWAIYCSESGINCLDRMNKEQVAMIYDWINPDRWQKKLSQDSSNRNWCQEILKAGKF